MGLVKAEHKLEQFQSGLQNELDWLERVEEKVQDRDSSRESRNAESVMEELTVSGNFRSVQGYKGFYYVTIKISGKQSSPLNSAITGG